MAIEATNPTVLAIDTSGPVAGCAVLRDGKTVHLTAMNHGLTHSETIMPAVDEALALLSTVDVLHDATVGSGYHYMVADASGDCAVVEFDKEDGWKTMVVRKEAGANSMLVTNHLLSPKYRTDEPDEAVGNPHSRSWWRYDTAKAYLDAHDGILTLEQAQECLSQVHWKDLVWDTGTVEDTQFSNVYDQKALTLDLRNWNDYGTTVHFAL